MSIIIVNHNRRDDLIECLNSVFSMCNLNEESFEVIVIDNNSSDGSLQAVQKLFPQVTLIALDRNYGCCFARNLGAKIARGKYIAFIDNDVIVSEKWFKNIVNAIKGSRSIVKAWACKIIQYENRNKIFSIGGKFTFIGSGQDIGFNEEQELYTRELAVGYACGASMVVDKNAFLEVGGFDEIYFIYHEELDLFYKFYIRGYLVKYVPSAVVYHKTRSTLGKGRLTPSKVFLCQRNRLMNILKNYEFKNIIIGIYLSIIYDIFRIIKLSYMRKHYIIKSIIKGYIFIINNISAIIKKRRKVNKIRRISDRKLYKLRLFATILESIKEEIKITKNEISINKT